jgi:hypothetical protein
LKIIVEVGVNMLYNVEVYSTTSNGCKTEKGEKISRIEGFFDTGF